MSFLDTKAEEWRAKQEVKQEELATESSPVASLAEAIANADSLADLLDVLNTWRAETVNLDQLRAHIDKIQADRRIPDYLRVTLLQVGGDRVSPEVS